jgi:tRNA(fMet)-specific endonuclease VapC
LIGVIGNKHLLLDTNAIIALQRDDQNLKKILGDATDVFVPIIVIGELYYGAYKSQQRAINIEKVTQFAHDRVILNVEFNTANIYGQIKQKLQAKGRPIPENDIWIASIAIQYDLVLITNDAHFQVVEGLICQGW